MAEANGITLGKEDRINLMLSFLRAMEICPKNRRIELNGTVGPLAADVVKKIKELARAGGHFPLQAWEIKGLILHLKAAGFGEELEHVMDDTEYSPPLEFALDAFVRSGTEMV